jgi:hypothetical protein
MLGELLPGIVNGTANAAETRRFGQLWQDRVQRLLIDHGDDPAIVEIQPVPRS